MLQQKRKRNEKKMSPSEVFSSVTVSSPAGQSIHVESAIEIEPVQVEAEGIKTGPHLSSLPAIQEVTLKREREKVIELRNVHKTYLIGDYAVAALRGVSMSVTRGEFVLIYGKSGSGKSTLLSVMGSVDLATKGDVHVLGTRVHHRTKDSVLANLRLTQIGFVFQSFNLLPLSSARENVILPMALAGRLGWRQRGRRADYLLEKVGVAHRKGNVPGQLSGGEQQRVTIARALANQPEMLLLDEPTGDLDGVNSDYVIEMLMDLHEEGRTVVMVTHDRALRAFADRVLYVHDGLISHEETVPEELRKRMRGALREKNTRRRAD